MLQIKPWFLLNSGQTVILRKCEFLVILRDADTNSNLGKSVNISVTYSKGYFFLVWQYFQGIQKKKKKCTSGMLDGFYNIKTFAWKGEATT